MKTKSIKISVIVFIVAMFSAIVMLFMPGARVAKAITTFDFEDGAYVKLVDNGGLRFRLQMDADTATDIQTYDNKTLIFYVASATRMSDVTTGMEAKALYDAKYAWQVVADESKFYPGKNDLGVLDGYYYSNVLLDINTLGASNGAYYNTEFVAAATIFDSAANNGDGGYIEFVKSPSRSLQYTASAAALRGGYYDKVMATSLYGNWLGKADYPIMASNESDYSTLKSALSSHSDLYFYLNDIEDEDHLIDDYDYGDISKYTVDISVGQDGYGSVSQSSVANVPYGTEISTILDGTAINVNGTTITATAASQVPQYTYEFNGWTNGTAKVYGNTTVTANFTRTVRNYTVAINVNNGNYGSVSAASLTTVPYGSSISFSGNTLTVGDNTVTATPNFGYKTENISITDGADGPTTGVATTITINFAVEATGIFYDSTSDDGVSSGWGAEKNESFSANSSEQKYNDKNSLKIVESSTDDDGAAGYFGFGVIFDKTKLNTLLGLSTYGVKLTFHYKFVRGSFGRGDWIQFGFNAGTGKKIASYDTWESATFIFDSAPSALLLAVSSTEGWDAGATWSYVNGTLYVSDITYELMNDSGTMVDFSAGENIVTKNNCVSSWSMSSDKTYNGNDTLKIICNNTWFSALYMDNSLVKTAINAGKSITITMTYCVTNPSHVDSTICGGPFSGYSSADQWNEVSQTFTSLPDNFLFGLGVGWGGWNPDTVSGNLYIAKITYTIS